MNRTLILVAIAVIAATVISAQESPQVPEFKNTIMIVKKDGSLDKTEKQSTEMKSKGGSGGYGWYGTGSRGNTMDFLTFDGEKSTVRVSSDAAFIVKLTDADTDPESVFYLTQAIPKKNKREVYLKKDQGRSVKEKMVKLNYEKVSPGVYKIKPEKLESGVEYAFVPVTMQGAKSGGTLVYLFGVK